MSDCCNINLNLDNDDINLDLIISENSCSLELILGSSEPCNIIMSLDGSGGGGGSGNATVSFQAIGTSTNDSNTVWSTVDADIAVTAGKKYFIQYRMRTYSASATTGIGLRRALVTATGTVYGWHARGHVNNATQSGGSSREGTEDDYVSAGNTTNTTSASGFFSVDTLFECTGSGTFRLEMRSEVNASLATIDGDGSYVIITEF